MADQQNLTKKEKKELRKYEWQEKAAKEQRNALYKKAGIIIGTIAVVVLSVFGLIKLSGTDSSSITSINIPPVSAKDMKQGNPKAKVTLVEYSDFQCPACAAYHPLVKQILADYNGRILFVY